LQVSAPSARRDPFALLSRLLIFRRERVTGWPRSWNCGPSAPIDHRTAWQLADCHAVSGRFPGGNHR
jgi:hypothetical protein